MNVIKGLNFQAFFRFFYFFFAKLEKKNKFEKNWKKKKQNLPPSSCTYFSTCLPQDPFWIPFCFYKFHPIFTRYWPNFFILLNFCFKLSQTHTFWPFFYPFSNFSLPSHHPPIHAFISFIITHVPIWIITQLNSVLN